LAKPHRQKLGLHGVKGRPKVLGAWSAEVESRGVEEAIKGPTGMTMATEKVQGFKKHS